MINYNTCVDYQCYKRVVFFMNYSIMSKHFSLFQLMHNIIKS